MKNKKRPYKVRCNIIYAVGVSKKERSHFGLNKWTVTISQKRKLPRSLGFGQPNGHFV